MSKSFVDIIKPFHLAWTLRESGHTLTEEQKEMLKIYDKLSDYSPKELVLNNNTAAITISEMIEFLK